MSKYGNIIYMTYIICFLFCLGLLFFFIAKYKEVSVEQDDSLDKEEDKAPKSAPDTTDISRIFSKVDGLPAREITDLKEKVKEFHYTLEETRLLEEKHYFALQQSVKVLEERLTTFENEYVNKLQPTLTTLISELEQMQNKTNQK